MGRSPCCDDNSGIKKGPWTPEEDKKLVEYVSKHGHGSWRALPKLAGLNRCGKSCRLRWANYLRPDIKRGKFSDEEEQLIIKLHSVLGNKWSTIAQRLPGRTDNEIKNYWNTNLRKKLLQSGIDPVTHRPRTDNLNLLANLPQLLGTSSFNTRINQLNNALGFQNTDIAQLAKAQMLHSLLQVLSTSPPLSPEALKLLGLSMPPHPPLHNYLPQIFDSTFEGLANFPVNFAPNQTPFLPNSSNLDVVYPPSQLAQITGESGAFGGDYKLDNSEQFRATWQTENSLPGLELDSPECSTMINQMEKASTSISISISNTDNTSKPSSSTVDAWGELEGGDSYWKDILDQVSSPSWTIS